MIGVGRKLLKASESADIVFVVADGGRKYISTGLHRGVDGRGHRDQAQLWA